MLKERIKQDIKQEASTFCTWAVVFDIGAGAYDDRKERTSIVATFRNPCNAEDFINLALPKENRDRFYIVSM